MPYEFYKIMHVSGVLLLFSALIGMIGLRMQSESLPARAKRMFFIAHGIGMLLALVGGFGLAARLGYAAQFPQWIWVKLAIWLFFGAAISIVKRKGALGGPLYMLFWGLAILGSWLAVTKPF